LAQKVWPQIYFSPNVQKDTKKECGKAKKIEQENKSFPEILKTTRLFRKDMQTRISSRPGSALMQRTTRRSRVASPPDNQFWGSVIFRAI